MSSMSPISSLPVSASYSPSCVTGGDMSRLATHVWDEVLEDGYSAREIVRLMASALAGKVSGAGSGTVVFRDINDTTDRITADVDEDGNRVDISLTSS